METVPVPIPPRGNATSPACSLVYERCGPDTVTSSLRECGIEAPATDRKVGGVITADTSFPCKAATPMAAAEVEARNCLRLTPVFSFMKSPEPRPSHITRPMRARQAAPTDE